MEANFQQSEIVFLMATGIVIMLCLALALVLFFNASQKKLLKAKNRSQELQLEHQKELLHSTILTQENERKRIAKDLHDEIGSKLNVVHLNLHRLKRLGQSSEEFQQTIGEVNQLINNTIDRTRNISHELLPPTLDDFGLVEAIKELCEGYRRSGSIQLEFNWTEGCKGLGDKMADLHLFRVLQELIKNSVIHGGAELIQLNLVLLGDKIMLNYKDDGKGFDTTKVEKKGMGLKNLETRTNLIHAKMDFQSKPGQGVEVSIEAPVLINLTQA